MTCSECRRYLGDYIDDLLEGDREAAFLSHLAECDECRKAAQEYQAVMDGLAALPVPSMPHGAEARMWRRIRRHTGVPWAGYILKWAAAPVLVVVFAAGYFFGGSVPLTQPAGPGDTASVCSEIFQRIYPVNPGSIYQEVNGGLQPVNADPSGVEIPLTLSSHGPYSMYGESLELESPETCIPFISPYGHVLVLRVTRDGGNSGATMMTLSAEPKRVFYHRVSWRDAGYVWMLEGRTAPDYLFDLAMEIRREI